MANPGVGEPRSQKTWLLELFTEGCLEINAGHSGWCLCPAGTGVLYPPGVLYWERTPSRERQRGWCKSLVLFFEVSGDSEWARRFGRPRRHRLINDTDGLLRRLANTILHCQEGGAGARLMAFGCFYQILATLMTAEERAHRLVVHETPPVPVDLVTTVHRYMRQHLDKSIRVGHIARHMGLSESGLAHAYRRLTGQPPMAALQQMRIETVKIHLLSNRFPLAQIAEHTGFADAYHLSRTFKKVTGENPRTFRSRMRERA